MKSLSKLTSRLQLRVVVSFSLLTDAARLDAGQVVKLSMEFVPPSAALCVAEGPLLRLIAVSRTFLFRQGSWNQPAHCIALSELVSLGRGRRASLQISARSSDCRLLIRSHTKTRSRCSIVMVSSWVVLWILVSTTIRFH